MSLITKTLFPVLKLSREEKDNMLEINRTIDDITGFLKVEKNSVHKLTIMYGPKICNFRCPKYCCTEDIAKGILTKDQLINVIDQASDMGAKVTYWPGLGELPLLKDFWDIQEYIHEKGIKSVVFTNGSLFWNDGLTKKTVGISSDDLIKKANELGIYFYVKYWNSVPEKAAEMVGVNLKEYPYTLIRGRAVPLALARLMKVIPRGRVGVEVMVSSENYDDVIKNIIPTIDYLDLYGYIEPIIFSGKAEERQDQLSLSTEQHKFLQDTFVSGGNYCNKRQGVEMILVGDRLSPGIVIPPREEDKVITESGEVKNIFEIYHNSYFKKVREISEKLNGCLCRAVWNGKVKL